MRATFLPLGTERSPEPREAGFPAVAAELSPPVMSAWQIFLRFLRFGLLAWGGPVAQIAMIRRERASG